MVRLGGLDGGDALTADREVDVEQRPLDLAGIEQVLDVEVGDQGVGLVDHGPTSMTGTPAARARLTMSAVPRDWLIGLS